MHRSLSLALVVLVGLPAMTFARTGKPDAAALEFFEKKIRPVLADHCLSCHGPEKKRGNLRLDSRAAVLKGGDTGPALVAGHPEKSLLVQAISYKEQLRMPPRSKLKEEQIADLTTWVKMGAPWPGEDKGPQTEEKLDLARRLRHWSFQPVRLALPPRVQNSSWTRNPIDQFVLAKLEGAGLAPASDAARRTLLRRVTFDLTGLPPTPEEIASFIADSRPGAYERVVERLLASPAYGERWGRHWLDLVRFAETSGHEFDFEIPHAEGYRDYVIRALNEDVRYDAFVREHLAGDLLPRPRRHPGEGTNESILGTGFWFLGESKHSPVDLRVDGADRRDNMIDVFGKAFLGLTISCARCHDHKFDPILTQEYYSLVSYLQSSRMQRAFLDPPERIAVPAQRLLQHRRQLAEQAIRQTSQALEARLARLDVESMRRSKGELYRPGQRLLEGTSLLANRKEWIGQVQQQREKAKAYQVFEDFTGEDYRDWFVTGDAFGGGPATTRDVVIRKGKVERVALGAHSGRASPRLAGALRSKTFRIEKNHIHTRALGQGVRINLIIDGFQQIRDPIYGGLTFVVQSDQPRWYSQDVSMWVGLHAYLEVLDDGDGTVELQQILFSDQASPPPERENPLLVEGLKPVDSPEKVVRAYRELLGATLRRWRENQPLSVEERALLNLILKSEDEAIPKVQLPEELRKLEGEIQAQEASLPRARRGLALAEGTGIQERVHIRGNPRTLGEEAPRRLPQVLVGERQPIASTGSGRLEMAERLTAPDNPLLARVLVNRLWQHHFGAGLVRSSDDFGHQGEAPTHPELLDWLAWEFQEKGYSLKHMHRLMVGSRTYQMASRGDEKAEKTDPRNELLHRMPIRRLEAEAIRDAMLAVSGRLDRTMFGKGPLPYLTEFMVGRGRPSFSGPLDGAGRRSLYLNVRRNFLTPMFLAFDYPVPFSTIGKRSVSNVPAQALTMLNNPFVLQQAETWAEKVRSEPARGVEDRLQRMYETAFAREATQEELHQAQTFLREQMQELGRSERQAWTDLAHVLFNVKEFLFVH